MRNFFNNGIKLHLDAKKQVTKESLYLCNLLCALENYLYYSQTKTNIFKCGLKTGRGLYKN